MIEIYLQTSIQNKKFEGYDNCLSGKGYQQDFIKYMIDSLIHDMHLQQRVRKSTLSPSDENRCYSNETESIPWMVKLGILIVCFVSMYL